jgi:DnaJ homolog subfamily A member 5
MIAPQSSSGPSTCDADKNAHQADEAHERFQEIQNAWEVLSDPQERAWYSSHREQILSSGRHQAGSSTGDAQAQSPHPDVDFERYMSRSAFSGFDDSKHSFFTVFGGLFSRLAKEEQEAYRLQKPITQNLKKPPSGPALGGADAEEADVKAFYLFWCNFQTIKDYAWLDAYNPNSAPGRRIRRLMEAENEKRRRGGKMTFVSQVRRLAERVRGKDPRMEVFKARLLKTLAHLATPLIM